MDHEVLKIILDIVTDNVLQPQVDVMEAVIDLALQKNENFFPDDRRKQIRSKSYYETIIPAYSPNEFVEHFRMSRATFESFLQILMKHNPRPRGEVIPVEKKVMFAIWMLAKHESFVAGSKRFGLAPSTAHGIFYDIISCILNLLYFYIKWPSSVECEAISQKIKGRSGIPGVIGAIHGCRVKIKTCGQNQVGCDNRNGQNSIILQAVCDDKGFFTDIFVGMPGVVNPASVYKKSNLYKKINKLQLLPNNQHLLGDSSYHLSQNLLVPFQDSHLTQEQTNFNQKLDLERLIIEKAFKFLKGKWQRLEYLDISLENKIADVIGAACVLHNFVLLKDNISVINDGLVEGNSVTDLYLLETDEEVYNDAVIKRNYIASLL